MSDGKTHKIEKKGERLTILRTNGVRGTDESLLRVVVTLSTLREALEALIG